MKQHDSLAPLSRDHHEALILARLLQKNAPLYKNLPTEADAKAEYAIAIYNKSLKDHFIKEEKVLQIVRNIHPDIDRLSSEIIEEHKQLSIAFKELNKNKTLVIALDTLGIALETHIRKEERILFPLIQQYCPEELLNTIVL